MGTMQTRRGIDPPGPDEGTRLLVTRYRPRGVRKDAETWDEWWKELGPSRALHAEFYGKGEDQALRGDFAAYRVRYLAEMSVDPGRFYLRALIGRVASGERITLLCSSACVDPARCHRTLLVDLVLKALARPG